MRKMNIPSELKSCFEEMYENREEILENITAVKGKKVRDMAKFMDTSKGVMKLVSMAFLAETEEAMEKIDEAMLSLVGTLSLAYRDALDMSPSEWEEAVECAYQIHAYVEKFEEKAAEFLSWKSG